MDNKTEITKEALGCFVAELEIGTEFSYDEGRTWYVVRTEPKYVSQELDNTDLKFMVSPWDDCSLSAWEDVVFNDRRHVLLNREWGKK